jgi:7,8-dihydropterin-6-yl-methyl-4-(beta-D-ribofuranosyl)aminobenzene 5'-phosphate synthase
VHGFSCLVTGYRGTRKHAILFDTGPEPYAFIRNCQRLDVDLGAVEAIVLSHGHIDHGGGLLAALDAIREQNGNHSVPFYAHPDIFRTRALMMPNGTMMPIEDIPDKRALTAHGAQVSQSAASQVMLDDMFCISGEVPRVTSFEPGLPGHYRRTADGKDWEPDPLVMDERFLAVNVARKGLIVLSGCSHAGIINVLRCARSETSHMSLFGLFGGLHLVGMNEPVIQQTVEAMQEFQLHVIAVGHCTGWRATNALTNAFGDQVVAPCAVGKRYVF